MQPIETGQQFGRYVIRGKLGAGGMAEVFLADDTQLGRPVALKFLPPETQADPLAQRRLLREARAAAILDHSHICAVYEVGETDGRSYIAMQYVEGETLDARLRRSTPELQEILAIAVQVVDALTEAHAHGILHRDIKPGNIMVTSRGHAKVMDFGLAKHDPASASAPEASRTMSAISRQGDIVGTAPYMSPEQARGELLDPRSDLFSVGVLLYEMVTRQRPFQGASTAALAVAILTSEPQPLARFAADAPAELDRIVMKLLRKQPDQRYQTAKDLLIDLRALKDEQEFQLRLGRTPAPSAPASLSSSPGAGVEQAPRRGRALGFGLGALVILIAGAWFAWKAFNAQPPATPDLSDSISVTTEPPGAQVFLTRFNGATAAPRQLLGTSPLSNVRVARGEYVVAIEKDGYAPIERTVSGVTIRAGALVITPPPIRIEQRLMPAAAVPARMVFVPGGDYRLVAWSRPTDRRIRLDDYFVDKYEVSNQEYKEFINAGGYVKREYWTHPFVKDGRTLPWEEAIRLLVDRTGLPGPRHWSTQNFPEGKADHPVTGVTWYEAEAYASFRGKQLATIYQWEKAARNGYVAQAGVTAMPWGAFYPGDSLKERANFGGATWPTTNAAFGMSAFGAYNMAGNVAEWTLNDSSDGFLATGGAWGDPTYTFSQFGGRPGFFSSEKLGFRCARLAAGSTGDQGGFRVELAQEVPVFKAASPQEFASLAAAYRYDKTPLDARIEQTTETPAWTRERITFNGANGARAIAYLYLPKNAPRPLQVIHLIPAGDVASGFRSLPEAMDDRMAPFVKAGRAVFGVVLEGYVERLRPAGWVPPDPATVEFTEMIVSRVTELRRGLDYLETRTDIDSTRIAALAPSAGAALGLILGAVEPRYRAFVFVGAGVAPYNVTIGAAVNPVNFAPYIRAPKLILQGRYDEDTPLRTQAEPLLKLFVEPKQMTLYDGGHVPSIEVAMSSTSGWLEQHLGRVFK